MPRHACLEEFDEFGLHEFIVVRNIEADDPLPAQGRAEPPFQFGAMLFFHHHDDVGP